MFQPENSLALSSKVHYLRGLQCTVDLKVVLQVRGAVKEGEVVDVGVEWASRHEHCHYDRLCEAQLQILTSNVSLIGAPELIISNADKVFRREDSVFT